jgi:hypothetical protein
VEKVTFHDCKRTYWESYKDDLQVYLEVTPCYIRLIEDCKTGSCLVAADHSHVLSPELTVGLLTHRGEFLGGTES